VATSRQQANIRGREAESHAAEYLAQAGLTLLARNFRCPLGEIDLIMLDQGALVFIEVKYRTNNRFGHGMEYVNQRKQRKLRNTALLYLNQHTRYRALPYRFDVIGISPKQDNPNKSILEVNWLKNALEMDW
jgi:putative endonuclease